jgi:hypothetical protein
MNYFNKYIKYIKKQNKKSNNQTGGFRCPVCLRVGDEIVSDGDTNNLFVAIHPCYHIICTDCISKITQNECPKCRADILGSEVIYPQHPNYNDENIEDIREEKKINLLENSEINLRNKIYDDEIKLMEKINEDFNLNKKRVLTFQLRTDEQITLQIEDLTDKLRLNPRYFDNFHSITEEKKMVLFFRLPVNINNVINYIWVSVEIKILGNISRIISNTSGYSINLDRYFVTILLNTGEYKFEIMQDNINNVMATNINEILGVSLNNNINIRVKKIVI